jgi:hypothetical protein
VTRVIYVEDPHQALPVAQRRDSEQRSVEAPHGEDPLVTADRYGRPIAIVRIGGRVPSAATPGATGAACDVPPLMLYDAASEPDRNCLDMVPDAALPMLRQPSHDQDATPR